MAIDLMKGLPDLRAKTRSGIAGRLADATSTLQRALGGSGLLQAPGPAIPAPLQAFLGKLGQPVAPAADDRSGKPPEGARFLAGVFTNDAGSRPYRLYVPGGYRPGRPAPLIVMLHGCTQSPEDFAAGTRMNEAAERAGCLVLYPGQTAAAHMQKCWKWFSPADQRRHAGEPSLIAGMTRQVMQDYAIDPRRVYVAGLSAGGAAAAIMGDAYPELFAAIGVHSGLACGAAHDTQSAFAAMQRGGEGRAPPRAGRRIVPAIVFHGDRDSTVNPRNAEAVVAQSAGQAPLVKQTESGKVSGERAYERISYVDASGKAIIEQWIVHGAGHAWSGGSSAGSFTDPSGPDATAEMMRFFLDHPGPA